MGSIWKATRMKTYLCSLFLLGLGGVLADAAPDAVAVADAEADALYAYAYPTVYTGYAYASPVYGYTGHLIGKRDAEPRGGYGGRVYGGRGYGGQGYGGHGHGKRSAEARRGYGGRGYGGRGYGGRGYHG